MLATPAMMPFQEILLSQLHRSIGDAPIRLSVGRGNNAPTEEAGRIGLIIHDRIALARILLDPEIGFGDAYMEGRVEVQGDLVEALEVVFRAMHERPKQSWYHRLVSDWLRFIQANTLQGAAANIHHHYDLDTKFYKLWLDPRLVYTCAYFSSSSASLNESQVAKLEYVCRKLQLQPGERVVEAGCGWGALALHMAKNFGVIVRAINLSHEQIEYAREEAKKAGLSSSQVEFINDDYRNTSGRFDAFVSVGMLEHIGREHYQELGRVIYRTIGNSGRGLLHFIGRNRPEPFSPWIRKRIFPGAYAPALREVMDIFEEHDYAIIDVENLRQHYAKTLEHWLAHYERSADRVCAAFGPNFTRAWRLYLAGSAASFRIGLLQLFQVVFTGASCLQVPWTRAHLYSGESCLEEESQWTHATF